MGMSEIDKITLSKQVIQLKTLGYSKTKALDILAKRGFKRRTASVYWKVFNEEEKKAAKGT